MSNSAKWYTEVMEVVTDRLGLLAIIASIELAVRHPEWKGVSREIALSIGRKMASRMIDDGLDIPPEQLANWVGTFGCLVFDGGGKGVTTH